MTGALRFDVFSLFPEVFSPYLETSILKRAQENHLVEICLHNIRDWTTDRHHVCDDMPYGGGGGMVMKPEPMARAILIHGDLHCANLFVNPVDHSFTPFDFDDCCYGWFAMDIAMSLFDLLVLYPGADRTGFANRFLQGYLKGYLHENNLEGFWIERLPLFLKLLEVEIYAMLAGDYSADENDSWSSRFMAGRAKRIEDNVPYIDIDFAEFEAG